MTEHWFALTGRMAQAEIDETIAETNRQREIINDWEADDAETGRDSPLATGFECDYWPKIGKQTAPGASNPAG